MANIFQRAISAVRGERSSAPLYPQTGTGGGGWSSIFSGTRSHGVPRLNEQQRLEQNVGYVAIAAHRVAEDVSHLRVTVEVLKRGGRWVPDPAHPLQRLIDYPTEYLSGAELRYLLVTHRLLLGRMAALVQSGSAPEELHPLYPHLLELQPHPTEFVSGYRYRAPGGHQQLFMPYRPSGPLHEHSVLETRVMGPADPYSTMSPVQASANSIAVDNEVRAYARFYYANNAMPGVVLESDQPHPGADKAGAMKAAWNDTYQGMFNAGKVATLFGGLKLRATAPAFKDLAFPETTRATRNDILAAMGVPAPILGISEPGALGAEVFRAAKEVYQSTTLDSHRRALEGLYNQLARRWPNTRVVIESPVEDDLEALEQVRQWQVGQGIITRGEYRAGAGLEDDGHGELWLVAGTWQPTLETAVETTPEPEPTATDTGGVDPEITRARASRYRAAFAAEYRAAKRNEPLPDLWADESQDVREAATRLRSAALERADLVTAYEALKSEGAKQLARIGGTHDPHDAAPSDGQQPTETTPGGST